MATSQITLVSINTLYYGGHLHVYEASDDQLLGSGLAFPEELPKAKPRSQVRFNRDDGIGAYRLPDGRVRLTILAALERQRCTKFLDFMAGLVVPVLVGGSYA